MNKKGFTLIELMIGAVILGSLLSVIFGGFQVFYTKQEITAHVIAKERVVSGSGYSLVSKYLIYTDKETFEDVDCFWIWKFNSSDFYGQIEIGNDYNFTVYGYRVPFFSWYRNIIKFEEIK